MGIHAQLVGSDGAAIRLQDPSGGTFDAAGDFDELMPVDGAEYPVLSQVDPFDDTSFSSADMDALLPEIDRLLASTEHGVQHRGLVRLRALASTCKGTPESALRFAGD